MPAAESVLFYLTFGAFLAVSAFLVVFVAVWVVRRDKEGRRRWLEEREADGRGDQPR